jgi:hypothetical protein
MRRTVFSGEDDNSPRSRAQRRRDRRRPSHFVAVSTSGVFHEKVKKNTAPPTLTENEALKLMTKQSSWIRTLQESCTISTTDKKVNNNDCGVLVI